MRKTIYYLDKNAEELLATETRTAESTREISEKEIDEYLPKYRIFKRNNKDETKYPIVDKIKEICNMSERLEELSKKDHKQQRMIKDLIDFAETVKKSRVGKIFFKKALNAVKEEDEIEK